MLKQARSESNGAHGNLVLITTTSEDGVEILSIAVLRNPHPSPAVALSNENFTSADVIGVPSLNLISVRSLIVHVTLSEPTVALFASHGLTSLPSAVIMKSGSYTCCWIKIESFCATSGLKDAKSWLRTKIKSPVGAAFAVIGTITVARIVAAASNPPRTNFLDFILLFSCLLGSTHAGRTLKTAPRVGLQLTVW